MDEHDHERRATLMAGAVLVVVGLAVLGIQVSGVDVGWPLWIVVPGVAIFVVALAVGGQNGSGFAALAGIVTSVGIVLAAQQATGAYASWAYAWALVAPGGVGAGLFLYGILTARWDIARGGLAALGSGVAIFLVGYLFFEGLLHLDGIPSNDVANLVIPGALVVLGLLVIAGAFLPRRWRGTEKGWGVAAGSPSGPAAPFAGAGAAAFAGAGPEPSGAWADAGTGGGLPPAAAAGAAAYGAPGTAGSTRSGGPGATASDPQARSVYLGGAASGEVTLAFGAGHLAIVGPAAAGHLVDGVFGGGVDREDRGAGRVKLTTPGGAFWGRVWSGSTPFEWRVGLSAEVPLRLGLEIGAARTDADLSALRVTDLRIRTGAAETQVILPAAAGFTRAEVEAGAASVRLQVPEGVGVRIRSTVALGTTDVDTSRFPRDPLGGWASPDYASAANRVDIEVRGGLGSVAIR